jgi:excisionase family DNA binding protein
MIHPSRRLAYTRREAAELLGVSEHTIDRLARRGLLKPIRATRRPLFSHAEISRFLNQPANE